MATHKSFKSYAKALQKYVTDGVRKAAVTSINKSLASTKTLAIKTAAAESGAKQKDIKLRVGVFKANKNRPKGAMVSFSKPVSLSIFSPKVKAVKTVRGKRYGATVRIDKERVLVPGGFLISKKRSGVFARVRDAALPIKKLLTNYLFKILSRPTTQTTLQKKAMDSFQKNFEHELKRNNQI